MADNENLKNCKCADAVKKQTAEIEMESFALQMLREYAKTTKKSQTICIIILAMWLATIGGFIWYLYQYDYSSYTVEGAQDGKGINIVSGSGVNNYGTAH